jgi:L-ribulose-5-phosphate 3-epimerase
VGLSPTSLRVERIARTKEVAAIAAELGIGRVACHIGFLPEDWAEMRDVVREICDFLSQHNQTFALETGQEDADALLAFIADADRRNLKINFDPANMVLYGTGNPLEALRALSEHVISVHCKDGVGPDGIGKLGTERPLGLGQVDFPAFLNVVRDVGYKGILSIEREEPDAERRNADIRHAIDFIRARINSVACD